MRAFIDNNSQSWCVQVTVDTVEQLRGELNLDLMQALGGDVIQRLGADPVLLVGAIYVTCESQIKERQLTERQFAGLIFGDVLEGAADAFFGAVTDFFPPRQRPILEKLLAKVREVDTMAAGEALTALDNPAVMEAAKRMIRKGEEEMLQRLSELGNSSGNVPA